MSRKKVPEPLSLSVTADVNGSLDLLCQKHGCLKAPLVMMLLSQQIVAAGSSYAATLLKRDSLKKIVANFPRLINRLESVERFLRQELEKSEAPLGESLAMEVQAKRVAKLIAQAKFLTKVCRAIAVAQLYPPPAQVATDLEAARQIAADLEDGQSEAVYDQDTITLSDFLKSLNIL
jgi:hypothetical protein